MPAEPALPLAARVAIVTGAGGGLGRQHALYLARGDDVGERLIAGWEAVSDPAGGIVPEYGFVQAEREVASAQAFRRR